MQLLCEAFLWHTLKGNIPTVFQRGSEKPIPIFGTDWPNYGFDEWFLLAAVYPRMAIHGVLTFVEWNDRFLNHWFALDIEYCTWANPQSEIIYHSEPTPNIKSLPESANDSVLSIENTPEICTPVVQSDPIN